jgi:virulence factor
MMLRIGVVDFDSSHAVEFTKRINHRLCPEDQWVNGAQVVLGCSLPSAITPPQQVQGYVETFTKELGVPMVDRPEAMIGKLDGVLIESVDGSVHLERARPFIEAGVPVFVDKPFTTSLAAARELAHSAAAKGTPVFSSSSLRYAPDVAAFAGEGEAQARVVGCDATSPASLHPRNPGFFHYAIHGVETLYTVMGRGCETVWCVSTEGTDVAVGRWKDGRLGTVRGTRQGAHAYGFTAFTEKGVRQVNIDTRYIYRELLKQIVGFFETKKQPLDLQETLEIVAFIEASLHSSRSEGAPRPLGL